MADWTKEKILELLATNDRAVGRALMVLRARQTQNEISSESTRHENGRGFKSCHGKRGTSMANFFETAGFLTPKQLAYWRKRDARGVMNIGCYHKQLLEEIEARGT